MESESHLQYRGHKRDASLNESLSKCKSFRNLTFYDSVEIVLLFYTKFGAKHKCRYCLQRSFVN